MRYQKCKTQPNICFNKQLDSPLKNKSSSRLLSNSLNFKRSAFIHNRFSLDSNLAKSPRKIVVEIDQPKKQFFKLPKIINEAITDQKIDQISNIVVKMKKFYYDPYGCSKSLKLQKVRIKKKIMGIGPSNKMLLQNQQMKHRKVKTFSQLSPQQQQKYRLKVYGDDKNQILSTIFK